MTDRKDFLKAYSGEPLRFMEVCGTHTAEISRNGITELLPPEISLISVSYTHLYRLCPQGTGKIS